MPSLSPLPWTYVASAAIPPGNRVALACNRPAPSRVLAIQQSSMLTYWYPAASRPFATIASAVALIRFSSMLHWNLFQLFQPIGGAVSGPGGGVAAAAGRVGAAVT